MKCRVPKTVNASLVIVDMQPDFRTSSKRSTIQNICREIRKAKRKGWLIISLLYEKSGPLIDPLQHEIGSYKPHVTLEKNDDDGSTVIDRKIPVHALKMIRVCGVNTCYCVCETAKGLKDIFPSASVVIVQKACNCEKGHESHFHPKNGVVAE